MKKYCITSPSNIALIKYWGKKNSELQWPANASVSMTLQHSLTTTIASLDHTNQSDQISFAKKNTDASKAMKHLNWLRQVLQCSTPSLKIETSNNFPTACGIASSASGMSALTIAALCAWTKSENFAELEEKGYDRQRLAQLSRMGSGSAGRSLWGGFVCWEPQHSPESQALFQLKPQYHWPLADLIVVISEEKKQQSSSEAHQSAWHSPLFLPRVAGIKEKYEQCKLAIDQKDLQLLGPLLEAEALEMHAVMMTSQPPANYLSKNTQDFLCWVREKRTQGQLKAWFTIDAGPNVHLICEEAEVQRTIKLLSEEQQYKVIIDKVGQGPTISVLQD